MNTRNHDSMEGERTPPSKALTHWLWGILPAGLTLVGLLIGMTWGFQYFVPGESPFGVAATYTILVPYYLVGVAGTIWLYHDAIYVIYGDGSWRPNPYRYFVGGAVVIALYFAATAPFAELTTETFVLSLLGRFVVSLPIASVVAGPIYVLNRNRYLAFSDES